MARVLTVDDYPLYAEIESLGVPALFHTGQTGIGAGAFTLTVAGLPQGCFPRAPAPGPAPS